MNRRELLASSGLLAYASLAGCVDDIDPIHIATADSDDIDTEAIEQLTAGNADFALDLFDHIKDQQDNVFISPYSISVALAMTYAGATGESRSQMEEVLRFDSVADTHTAFADLATALESRETTVDSLEDEEVDAFELDVTNALWLDEGMSFSQEYLDLISSAYDATLESADFASDHEYERERINDWIAEQTEERIEVLLPEGSLSALTVLVLTNAIYFKASWLFEFDPDDTTEETFTAIDGSEEPVPMMQQNVRTNYADFEGGEAVEMPYVGEEVSMVLILPEEGTFESFESDLDGEQLLEIFDQLQDSRGDLVMPRFEYKMDVGLSNALGDMGMPAAFSGGFDDMFESAGAGVGINEVFHEAFISVDEQGTEAAAATAVEMIVSEPPNWGEIRFDRPFIYCIRDRPTDAVLFLGRVGDAADAATEFEGDGNDGGDGGSDPSDNDDGAETISVDDDDATDSIPGLGVFAAMAALSLGGIRLLNRSIDDDS